MISVRYVSLSFGQLGRHLVQGCISSLDHRLEFDSLGASFVERAVQLMSQTRSGLVQSLDVVSRSVVIGQQALRASRLTARVTVQCHRFPAMADARPAVGRRVERRLVAAAAEVGRRIGQFGQRHQPVALEAMHELVRQDARRAQHRSAVETFGHSQSRVFRFAGRAGGRVPAVERVADAAVGRIRRQRQVRHGRRKILEQTGRCLSSGRRSQQAVGLTNRTASLSRFVQEVAISFHLLLLFVPTRLAEGVQAGQHLG